MILSVWQAVDKRMSWFPRLIQPAVLACCTLLPDIQSLLSEEGLLPEYTAVLLNILAVDHRYQKQGIGKYILAWLIANMLRISAVTPLDYLLVEAFDEKARDYYLHINFGFVLLPDGKLILPIGNMRSLLNNTIS